MPANDVSKVNHNQSIAHRPGDIFGAMRDEMDRMFERFERGGPRWPTTLWRDNGYAALVPELDVRDNGRQLTIEVDLPGLDEKDVSVTLVDGLLTIKGERKCEREESKDNYTIAERSYGAFERSLRLPATVDDGRIEARFDRGVLKIVAHKRPDAIKAEKKIEIKKS